MLSRKKLAEMLGVTDRTVDNYRKMGMPFLQLPSGIIRFEKEDVLKWIKERKESSNEKTD